VKLANAAQQAQQVILRVLVSLQNIDAAAYQHVHIFPNLHRIKKNADNKFRYRFQSQVAIAVGPRDAL